MHSGNKNIRILLVDDDERNLRILELILEDEFELTMASTGEQALQKVNAIEPDIILLDVMMPGMSGIDVCKHIKSSGKHKNIKIILLSGLAMAEDRVAGYEAGADDYLGKPFNDEELLAKVRVYAKLKFAEEINQLKTNFLSLIRHETSTPLNAIIGYSSLMASEEEDEEKKEFLLDIKSSASALHHKIEQILLLSRLMNAGPIEKQEVSLEDLFIMAVDALEFDEEKQARVDIHIDKGEVVFCDPALLQKALGFLLDNSLRHTTDESRTTCSCSHSSKDYLEITIADQGDGIDEKRLASLFEPFHEPNFLSHAEGLAISLALCREIITLHGGEINITNRNSGGLCVEIKIPYGDV